MIPEDDWLLAKGIKRINDATIQRVVLTLHPAFLQGFLAKFVSPDVMNPRRGLIPCNPFFMLEHFKNRLQHDKHLV